MAVPHAHTHTTYSALCRVSGSEAHVGARGKSSDLWHQMSHLVSSHRVEWRRQARTERCFSETPQEALTDVQEPNVNRP